MTACSDTATRGTLVFVRSGTDAVTFTAVLDATLFGVHDRWNITPAGQWGPVAGSRWDVDPADEWPAVSGTRWDIDPATRW